MKYLTIVVMIGGFAPLLAEEPTSGDWLEKSKAVAMDAFATMSGELAGQISEGGVAKALPFCHEKAGPLAKKMSEKHGVSLSRISHRPRNPAQMVDDNELAMSQAAMRDLADGKPAMPHVKTGTDAVTVYLPILFPGGICSQCHGEPGTEIKEKDLALIRGLYPKDQATGFKAGDLRGFWKIVWPLPPPNAPR
jgi:hypothetical protein